MHAYQIGKLDKFLTEAKSFPNVLLGPQNTDIVAGNVAPPQKKKIKDFLIICAWSMKSLVCLV